MHLCLYRKSGEQYFSKPVQTDKRYTNVALAVGGYNCAFSAAAGSVEGTEHFCDPLLLTGAPAGAVGGYRPLQIPKQEQLLKQRWLMVEVDWRQQKHGLFPLDYLTNNNLSAIFTGSPISFTFYMEYTADR